MDTLEFGYCQTDITPACGIPLAGYFNPRPNKGALDRLNVKTAVFRTGREYAAVVSCDLCMIDGKFVDKLEAHLAADNSPLAGKVLYCATHTHTGPYTAPLFGLDPDPAYMDILENAILSTLSRALTSLAPAELYTTVTECTTLAFNRRYIMKDGKTLTNPGKLNADILRPEGGIDPKIILLEIRQNGQPALLIANISNHTDTIGGDFVSADWPGKMEREIQYALGFDLPVMTIIAPQGNINHFNVATAANQTGYEEACRIGKGYAGVILAALYQLKKQENTAIVTKSGTFAAPYYQLTDAEYAEAKKVYEENKNAVMEDGKDFTSEDIARGVPAVKKLFAEMALSCRDNPITEERICRQFMISFGDELAIVSLPAEPFVELGDAIRAGSRFPLTVLAALGMGEIGYVGLKDRHYGNGGYETLPARVLADRGVGEAIINGALELLK